MSCFEGKSVFLLQTPSKIVQNTFLTCLLLFCIGSAVCGAAQSSTMLIVGRAVAGMGGAGLMNGALIILNACVPAHKQPGNPSFGSL
jgi:MFS family permease